MIFESTANFEWKFKKSPVIEKIRLCLFLKVSSQPILKLTILGNDFMEVSVINLNSSFFVLQTSKRNFHILTAECIYVLWGVNPTFYTAPKCCFNINQAIREPVHEIQMFPSIVFKGSLAQRSNSKITTINDLWFFYNWIFNFVMNCNSKCRA